MDEFVSRVKDTYLNDKRPTFMIIGNFSEKDKEILNKPLRVASFTKINDTTYYTESSHEIFVVEMYAKKALGHHNFVIARIDRYHRLLISN